MIMIYGERGRTQAARDWEHRHDDFYDWWKRTRKKRAMCFIGYEVFATPSFTPPVHLLFFRSHATVPKLVVRRILAFNAVNLSHFFDSASMSVADGKVLPTTPERGFCTCFSH
jgi:hypothetical protein